MTHDSVEGACQANGLVGCFFLQCSYHCGGALALIMGLWLQTAATTAKVGEAMAKANAAMAAMGATNDPVKVAQTMQQFSKENAKMEMGQEMMDDTLDGVFDDDEVEGETDDLMNQASLAPPRFLQAYRWLSMTEKFKSHWVRYRMI